MAWGEHDGDISQNQGVDQSIDSKVADAGKNVANKAFNTAGNATRRISNMRGRGSGGKSDGNKKKQSDRSKSVAKKAKNATSKVKNGGKKLKQVGGKAMQAAGKGTKMAGKVAETTGKGIEAAGKGIQAAGKAAEAGGAALKGAGAAMQAIPVVGNIAGGIVGAAGAGVGAIGTGLGAAGKGTEAAGKGAQAVGKGLGRIGNAMHNAGKKMASNAASAVGDKFKAVGKIFFKALKNLSFKVFIIIALVAVIGAMLDTCELLEKAAAFTAYDELPNYYKSTYGNNGQSLASLDKTAYDELRTVATTDGVIPKDTSAMTEEEREEWESDNESRKKALDQTTMEAEKKRIGTYFDAERDSILLANENSSKEGRRGGWLSFLFPSKATTQTSGSRFSFINDEKDFNDSAAKKIEAKPNINIETIRDSGLEDKKVVFYEKTGDDPIPANTTVENIPMGKYIFDQMESYALSWKLLYFFDKAFDDMVGENKDDFSNLSEDTAFDNFFRKMILEFMPKFEFQRHLKKEEIITVTTVTDKDGNIKSSKEHRITYTPVYFMTRVETWNKIISLDIQEDKKQVEPFHSEQSIYDKDNNLVSTTTIDTTGEITVPIPGIPNIETKEDKVREFFAENKLVYYDVEYELDNDRIEAALWTLQFVPGFYSIRYDVASTFNIELESIDYLGFGGNYTIPEDQAEFVESLRMIAAKLEAETGVPAAITIAQACLETGYGKSVPTDINTGQYSFNLFGVKAVDGQPYVESWTREVYNGVEQRIVAKFAAYTSFEESLKGHNELLLKPHYAKCMAVKNDPIRFAYELENAGYATDPEYAEKLISIMMRFNLLVPFDSSFNPVLPTVDPNNVTRADIVNVAKSILGLSYRWGGKYPHKGIPPRTGLDCSGYVQWIYVNTFGKQIGNGGGTADIFSTTSAISMNELKPGDLGLLNGTGNDDHVGMFIGRDTDGTPLFIHAGGKYYGDSMHPTGKVLVSRLSSSAGGKGGEYMGNHPVSFYYFRRVPGVSFND